MADERRSTERYPVKATVFARAIEEKEYQDLLAGGAEEPLVPSVAGISALTGGYKAETYYISEGGIGIDGDLEIKGKGKLAKGERLVLAIDIEGHPGRIKAMGRVVAFVRHFFFRNDLPHLSARSPIQTEQHELVKSAGSGRRVSKSSPSSTTSPFTSLLRPILASLA